MNNYRYLITISVFCISIAVSLCISAQVIPSSPRSQGVYERVAPRLARLLEAEGLRFGDPLVLRILKHPGVLEVWVKSRNRYSLFRKYKIYSFGRGGYGPKVQEGDGKAPEGLYSISPRQLNPWSKFHLSINIGYPNDYDRFHGRTGSHIMIHGSNVSRGCFAMSDNGIEEIYTLVEGAFRNGVNLVPLHCFPFPLTDENLSVFDDSPWYDFWIEMKRAYELLSKVGLLVKIRVENGRYIIIEPSGN